MTQSINQDILLEVASCFERVYTPLEWEDFVRQYKYYPSDFIYDVLSGWIFYSVKKGYNHEELLTTLYYAQCPKEHVVDPPAQYIQKNLGVFRSRSTPFVYAGPGFKLHADLHILRRDLTSL